MSKIKTIYLWDMDTPLADCIDFPLPVKDECEMPERIRVFRQNTSTPKERHYKFVEGVLINDCPLYFEIYKDEIIGKYNHD